MNALILLTATTTSEDVPVRPGWTPLIIILLMGAVVAFLFFSMRKQMRRIDIPEEGVPTTRQKTEEPS